MNICKSHISFLVWPSCVVLGSVLLTYLGWHTFVIFFRGAMPAWVPEMVGPVIIWICLWPSLLLESIGFQICNDSSGFIPNGIGWGIVGIVLAYIRHRRALPSKVLNRTVDPTGATSG